MHPTMSLPCLLLSISSIFFGGASSARLRSGGALSIRSLIKEGAQSERNPSFDNSSAHCNGPCQGSTLRFGGSGGTPFDDLNQGAFFNMESISLSTPGGSLAGIQVNYDNGAAPWHGRNDGNTHVCNIRPGGVYDPLVSVQIWHSPSGVQGMVFNRKSGGRCGQYGGKGATWVTQNILPPREGLVLAGIFGRSGSDIRYGIDGLGFYWGKDLSECDHVISTSGRWVNIRNFPVPTEFAIEIGTTHGEEFGRSREWGQELALTVSAGFEFGAASGSVEVGSTWSESISQSYSASFERSTTKTTTFSFPAGSLWQWQFSTRDPCGTSTTFQDYQITPNTYQQPCCPPGLFEDPTKPSGFCVDDSVSLQVSSCPKHNSS